jgi:beta-fructofuranosidase
VVIFNINAAKPTEGWGQIMSLPRRLSLLPGKDQLAMEPAGTLESLRFGHQRVSARPLPANREIVLDGVQGNALEIVAEIDPGSAPLVEMNVLRSSGKEEFTRIAFYKQRGYPDWDRLTSWEKRQEASMSLVTVDSSYSSELPDVLSRAPETAPVYLEPDEPIRLRVFIDKSVVEVFINGRQCVALRVYPGRADSIGVSLRAQGRDAELKSLDAWQMKSIYE